MLCTIMYFIIIYVKGKTKSYQCNRNQLLLSDEVSELPYLSAMLNLQMFSV